MILKWLEILFGVRPAEDVEFYRPTAVSKSNMSRQVMTVDLTTYSTYLHVCGYVCIKIGMNVFVHMYVCMHVGI